MEEDGIRNQQKSHAQKLSVEQRKEILKRLFALAAATREELKPEQTDIYLQRLEGLPYLELLRALTAMLDTCKWFPKIPEIREAVLGDQAGEAWQHIAYMASSWADRMEAANDAMYSGFSCGREIAKFDLSGLDKVARLALTRLGGPEAVACANPAHLPLMKKDFVSEYNHIRDEHPHLLLEDGGDTFQKLLTSTNGKGLKQLSPGASPK